MNNGGRPNGAARHRGVGHWDVGLFSLRYAGCCSTVKCSSTPCKHGSCTVGYYLFHSILFCESHFILFFQLFDRKKANNETNDRDSLANCVSHRKRHLENVFNLHSGALWLNAHCHVSKMNV
jgi:hypothetical protein